MVGNLSKGTNVQHEYGFSDLATKKRKMVLVTNVAFYTPCLHNQYMMAACIIENLGKGGYRKLE